MLDFIDDIISGLYYLGYLDWKAILAGVFMGSVFVILLFI